jgi:hypothetical protein
MCLYVEITIPATFAGFGMDAVESCTDILPAGGGQDVCVAIQNRRKYTRDLELRFQHALDLFNVNELREGTFGQFFIVC